MGATIQRVRFTSEDLARLGYLDDAEPGPTRHITLGESPLWESAFVVGISGAVRSKSNFRRGGRGRRQRWSQVVEFEKRVRHAVEAAKPSTWPETSLAIPVAARPQVVSVCYARAVLDTSNLTKSILDAVEGILYPNDAVVRGEYSQVERGSKDQLLVCGFAAYQPEGTGGEHPFEVAAALWTEVKSMFVNWDEEPAEDSGEKGA